MYVRLMNGAFVEYAPWQLEAAYPGRSFPTPMNPALMARYDMYPVTDTPQPEHDPTVESLDPVYVQVDGATVERQWQVTPLPLDQAKANTVARLAARRHQLESAGVTWTDGGTTYFFDTSVESQNRFAAARTAAVAGIREDGKVWKCALAATGEITFKPLTNTQLVEVSDLVHNHIQACFEAEATAVAVAHAATTVEQLSAIDLIV